MRSFLVLACMGVMLFCAPTESDANTATARLGVSNVSGFAGVEYQMDKIAVGVGWSPLVADNETKQGAAISLRYFFQPENSGPTVGLSLETVGTGGTLFGYIADSWPVVNVAGGYRFVFGQRFDLILGAGYGLILGIDELDEEVYGASKGKVAIDLAFGISFN